MFCEGVGGGNDVHTTFFWWRTCGFCLLFEGLGLWERAGGVYMMFSLSLTKYFPPF